MRDVLIVGATAIIMWPLWILVAACIRVLQDEVRQQYPTKR